MRRRRGYNWATIILAGTALGVALVWEYIIYTRGKLKE